MAVDLVLLPRRPDSWTVDWPPPFTAERLLQPSSLIVTPEEKGEVSLLVDQVVNLVREGVTGLDLLEVFLSRNIQPLQARDHPMWMYSGIEDSTRIHPEEVDEKTVAQWPQGITGNKDNPRGSRRVPPFDHVNEPEMVRLFPSECLFVLACNYF